MCFILFVVERKTDLGFKNCEMGCIWCHLQPLQRIGVLASQLQRNFSAGGKEVVELV